MICINLSCYEDILHKRELTGGRSNGKSFSLIFSEMFLSPRNYMYEGATLAICRGGGMSSNLGGGGTFEFSFTLLSRRRFAPPRLHSFTGAFRARDIMTSLQ